MYQIVNDLFSEGNFAALKAILKQQIGRNKTLPNFKNGANLKFFQNQRRSYEEESNVFSVCHQMGVMLKFDFP